MRDLIPSVLLLEHSTPIAQFEIDLAALTAQKHCVGHSVGHGKAQFIYRNDK